MHAHTALILKRLTVTYFIFIQIFFARFNWKHYQLYFFLSTKFIVCYTNIQKNDFFTWSYKDWLYCPRLSLQIWWQFNCFKCGSWQSLSIRYGMSIIHSFNSGNEQFNILYFWCGHVYVFDTKARCTLPSF